MPRPDFPMPLDAELVTGKTSGGIIIARTMEEALKP